MKLLVLSALVVVALSKSVKNKEDELAQWELFKIEHEKEYTSVEEEELRQNIFLDNLNFVNGHNAKYERGEVSFNVEINKFADLTAKEFSQMMNGVRVKSGYKKTGDKFVPDDDLELPKTVDWRKKGAVTPVKDQGMCASSWAFSATGSLEGQTFIKKKKLTSLSEQNLIDCSNQHGTSGCQGGGGGGGGGGGLVEFAFMYIQDNNGIDTESSYPYEGTNGTCRYDPKNKGAVETGFNEVFEVSEKVLQKAAATVGSLSVSIDGSHPSFQLYKSGVYLEPACSSVVLDSDVLAVGYGNVEKGGAYWLVKNSYGTSCGMGGYMMMARNHDNMCGIASLARYPTV